jgi:putative nucleotidyltransferase with HDIG domain
MVPEFEVSEDSCRSILATCRLIITNREGGISIDSARLDETSDQVLGLFKGSDALDSPRLARSYFDDYTFHHSVNVCLIATSVASTMVKDEALLRSISKAALLHDVGKREIPAEIIHKPGKLTPEEFEVVQKHPSYGAEILLAVDGIDPLCVAVAYGHHMQSGPGSYPKTRRILKPGWITQLISVVDIYEALTAVRPYKKGLSPETAFRILFSMVGVQDRLPLLKLLYDALGRYPVGTYVELSTGERAVVIGQNLSAPDRPRVRVLTDADRSPLEAPREVNLVKEGEITVRRSIVAQTVRADPLRDDPEEATDILGEPLGDTRVLMAREG